MSAFLLKKAWKIGIFIVSLLCKEVKYINNYNLNKKTPYYETDRTKSVRLLKE